MCTVYTRIGNAIECTENKANKKKKTIAKNFNKKQKHKTSKYILDAKI